MKENTVQGVNREKQANPHCRLRKRLRMFHHTWLKVEPGRRQNTGTLLGSLLGAPCGSHAVKPGDSSPTPAGYLGFCRKIELEGLSTRGHLGHWREGRDTILERGELIEILQTEMKLFSNLALFSFKNTVNQAHIPARGLEDSSLEKTNTLKGKKKIECYWHLENSPDEMVRFLRSPSVLKSTNCKVLPKHKRFWISVLLILGKSLLERQGWKQAQRGKGIWRKEVMLGI